MTTGKTVSLLSTVKKIIDSDEHGWNKSLKLQEDEGILQGCARDKKDIRYGGGRICRQHVEMTIL